jgi:hypothetical protein
MIIYTVIGYCYEDTILIKSFTFKKDASAFIKICEDYDGIKPKCKVGVRIVDELIGWNDGHPAGVIDFSYDIEEHELEGVNTQDIRTYTVDT